jgi:peptidoglycan/xylan/chitin deacetylase (PgdA/CDA1 family)
MFHDVRDPEWFEEVIVYLARRYKLVDLSTIEADLARGEFHEGRCHISFDDGHESFYHNVLPVIRKHSVPATIFISPQITRNGGYFWFQKYRLLPREQFDKFVRSKLSGKLPDNVLVNTQGNILLKSMRIDEINDIIDEFCGANQIRFGERCNLDLEQLSDILGSRLVEVGAHTLRHPILANEEDKTVESEIGESIIQTSELVGRPVRYFACPNGLPGYDFGEREIHIMKNHGIKLNMTTLPGPLTDRYGCWSVPRIGISKGSLRTIGIKIRNAGLWSLLRDKANRKSEFNQRRRMRKVLQAYKIS